MRSHGNGASGFPHPEHAMAVRGISWSHRQQAYFMESPLPSTTAPATGKPTGFRTYTKGATGGHRGRRQAYNVLVTAACPRTLAFLLVGLPLLPSCAGGLCPMAPPESEAPPVAEEPPVPEEPPGKDEPEVPLPPSILIDASVTRGGKDGRPPVTVNVRGGEPVPWTSTDLALEPLPFDPAAVAARPQFVDHWKTSEDEPGTVRVCSVLEGMPADALFLELLPADSEVIWADGSRGTFRGIHAQGQTWSDWGLDVVTTVPPGDPGIRSLAIALDLHRTTRVRRHEASVGVGEAASFELGECGRRWILPEDLEVTEFEVTRYGKPREGLFARGLRSDRLVRLADGTGAALRVMGSGGAGSVCQRDWGFWPEREFVPPLKVTVDLPLETATTRIVLRMENLVPKR